MQDGNSSKWELASKCVYQMKNKHDGNKWYKARLIGKDMLTNDFTHDKFGLCEISVGFLA